MIVVRFELRKTGPFDGVFLYVGAFREGVHANVHLTELSAPSRLFLVTVVAIRIGLIRVTHPWAVVIPVRDSISIIVRVASIS